MYITRYYDNNNYYYTILSTFSCYNTNTLIHPKTGFACTQILNCTDMMAVCFL